MGTTGLTVCVNMDAFLEKTTSSSNGHAIERFERITMVYYNPLIVVAFIYLKLSQKCILVTVKTTTKNM